MGFEYVCFFFIRSSQETNVDFVVIFPFHSFFILQETNADIVEIFPFYSFIQQTTKNDFVARYQKIKFTASQEHLNL